MSRTDDEVEDLPVDENVETKPADRADETPANENVEIKSSEVSGSKARESVVRITATRKMTEDSDVLSAATRRKSSITGDNKKRKSSIRFAPRNERSSLFSSGTGEEEEEEGEEEVFEEEEEEIIYLSEDLISGPYLSEESTVEGNILEFDHSYGYDCKRYFNIVVPDEKTIIFLSGNLIHVFDVRSKKLWFRRSALGGGLGHAQINPNPIYHHLAIAENGRNPPIIIYMWPSLEVVCVLKGGATRRYTYMDYSPDGELMVSQAGEPDYLITVWNWPKHKILLRTKSYVNEVYKVKFSPYCPGQITTCGLSHIKFWKMASTFTGLKLQGELGRFGKTEYSDIIGVLPMPDEKVVSGSYWGNILVWDAGLIKVEVFRKKRKHCHSAPIVKIDFRDGELWTVGMDGWVRVWYYDTIDQADPPDDDRVVEMDPIYEFQTPGASHMNIVKANKDINNFLHYTQDGNGGLWRIDLSTEGDAKAPFQLYKCHAGQVRDIAACPWGHYLASLGDDGRLMVYNYVAKKIVFIHQFPAKGRCMIWFPLHVEISGDEIAMGFDDGQIRVMVVSIDKSDDKVSKSLLQVIKPHNKPVTCMTINESGTIMVTGGEDSTIFIFQMVTKRCIELEPIGFIPVLAIPTCLTWHQDSEVTIIVGCMHGEIVQVEVPNKPVAYTKISYLLQAEPLHQKFVTYKSQIRRDIELAEIQAKKDKKLELKKKELEQIKKDNPGLEIDEEVFLADSESEEILPPLYIPEVPNRILWIQQTRDDTLWLSMAGYDAGYIYEYKIDQKDVVPYHFQMVFDGDDSEISAYVYDNKKKYFICAMQDGSIRVNKINPEDWRDLSDYWKLSMHDNFNGFVPKLCFSYDEKYFFSCGYDGNVFSYKFYPENLEYLSPYAKRFKLIMPSVQAVEIKDYAALSLEEKKVKDEFDRKQRIANLHKDEYLNKLSVLKARFSKMLTLNSELLPTQIIPRHELELDERITQKLESKLDADLALVNRKLSYQVEKSKVAMMKLRKHFTDPLDYLPIRVTSVDQSVGVRTFRQRKLSKEFYDMFDVVEQKILEAELRGRPPERQQVKAEAPPPVEKKEKQLEYFLLGLSPSTLQLKLGAKLNRLLNKYRTRKMKWEKRQEEWNVFNALKPDENVNPPEDEAALKQAALTIGDYKLKSSPTYKVPSHLRESTVKKYKNLLKVREKQYNLKHNFNEKVYQLRDKKVKLREFVQSCHYKLDEIHKEIPTQAHKFGLPAPEIDSSLFPEKNLEVVVQISDTSDTTLSEKSGPIFVEPPDSDALECEILLEIKPPEKLKENILEFLMDSQIRNVSNSTLHELLMFAENEDEETPWETEIRVHRLNRKLFEQDQIIQSIEDAIKDYDNQVQKLCYERLQVQVDGDFLDLHYLTINQELIILKEFEAVEDTLSEKVNQTTIELMDMQDLIMQLNNKLETHKREVDKLQEEEKAIQQQFFAAVLDNKFYDFLRRIFKKKYRPPKIRNPDDSESDSDSSSSSSSEEQDEGSIDSRDFGIIRLDESVCPKGCDQALYDLSFTLRSQRHVVELQIKEETKNIELLKKEIEVNNKKRVVIENNLRKGYDELEIFQRDKQHRLNTILRTVCLKLSQLQHLKSVNTSLGIRETLVFSKTVLTKLYKRVGQLATETLQQKAKHKVNINHLARMKKDCDHMEKSIEEIKGRIKELSTFKFGKVIDVNELEEALLKRLVLNLRMSMLDIRGFYEAESALWNNKYHQKQSELLSTIQDNTSRLELMGLLNHEKSDLAKEIASQERKRQYVESVEKCGEAYSKELEELSNIAKKQRAQLQLLRDEIQRLKTKGLPAKIEKKPKPKHVYKEVIEQVDELYDWTEYEEYVKYIRQQAEQARQERMKNVDSSTPSVRPQELARALLQEMIEFTEVELMKRSSDIFTDEAVTAVMSRATVAEIIEDLIHTLSIEPNKEQMSIIEKTAERLYSLQEPEVMDDDIQNCAKELLGEIMENVGISMGDSYEVLEDMIKNIVQQLPWDFLQQQESINTIASKFCEMGVYDRRKIANMVASISSIQKGDDIPKFMNRILEKVFGTGIDFLYVIPKSIQDLDLEETPDTTSNLTPDEIADVVSELISDVVVEETSDSVPYAGSDAASDEVGPVFPDTSPGE